MTQRFVEAAAPTALCRAADGGARAIARRLLRGDAPAVAAALATRALAFAANLERSSGRVQGSAAFEDRALHALLAAALPAPVAASLRARFEWYGCFGAFFHNDAHYDGVLFGVLAIAGPPRDVVFPRADVRVPANPGSWVVFDPFEPHGVLAPERTVYRREDYVATEPSLFVGFELELLPAVRAAFGIDDAVEPAAAPIELSSRTAINAETGAIA